jgi:hypothetical protein
MIDKGISIILVFLIILGIFVSSVTVFASGIAESKEEWIELYNPTNSDIDISGLILRDNRNSWNLPFSTVINARSTIIIAKNETGFRNLYDVYPDVSGMSLGLNNDGDVLSLMTGNVIIVEVYPNTYIPGDTAGEFVRIHNPTENSINLGGWHITDLIKGNKITFPEWANISAGDSLYLAYNATIFYDEMLQKADFEYGDDSDQTPNMDRSGWGLRLNDDGDKVILKNDRDEIIDVVIYGNSDYTGPGWTGHQVKGVKSGVILERDRNETTGKYEDTDSVANWDDYRIYVVGQSHFPYVTFSFNGTVTVFTSPDSSFREIANAIENANESIYVNVYLFHNLYLMDHLIEAINRSVNVKVLLEGDPVNRIDDTENYIAEQIVNAGGEVRFMIDDEGIHDRYKYDHAKYAIIDNRSTMVMSENWKNTGVPVNTTFGNRGWGIIIYNPNVTNYFRDVFFEDWKPESKDSFTFTCDDPDYGCPPPDFAANRLNSDLEVFTSI